MMRLPFVVTSGRSDVGAGIDQTRILENVSVNREGLIFRHGRICGESFVAPLWAHHWRRPSRYAWFLVRNGLLRRQSHRVDEALWIVDNFSPGNYHHWLIDCLSRLVSAELLYPSVRRLLLPDYYRSHPYVEFTLGAFPAIHVHWVDARSRVYVERLSFVPRPTPVVLAKAPTYRADLLRHVARRVADLAGEAAPARRVYISRADAERRRAANESDVVRVLDAAGVEVVKLDPAKPWEQVRIAMGAELLVSVHGAALSNLIFMPPGGRVIELRRAEQADLFFFDHYRPLAEACGLRYRAVFCDIASAATGWDRNDADVRVDLDVLRASLDEMS